MKKKSSVLAMIFLTAAISPAQVLTTLHNFSFDERGPIGGLAMAGNVLYGTTVGDNVDGTLFAINTNGTGYTALAELSGDEAAPQGNLAVANGMLYGASLGGNYGSVFSINTNGDDLTELHAFGNSPDGAYSHGSLTLSGTNLYGTTTYGGITGNGTVFFLDTDGNGFTVLHSFTNTPDGSCPSSSVVVSNNMLYGTTSFGGSNYCGTVFSMKIDGSDFIVLYHFSNGSDGAYPLAGLTLSGTTLYGTTSMGGDNGYGTVFSLNTDGSNFKTIFSFAVTNANTGNGQIGTEGNLLLSGSTLYGATFANSGDVNGSGYIYSLYIDGGAFCVLHNFSYADADDYGPNDDGAIPWADDLVMSGHTVYGTTAAGGANGSGTVFALQLPAPQPEINRIVANTNNTVTIFCSGGVDFTYLAQAATNLSPPVAWQNISTNIADTNGHWQFTDSITNGFFSSIETNLVYSILSISNTPIGPVVYYSTNVIGTNVTITTGARRFYRAAVAP